jgi:hypothetical protein
MAVQFDEQAVPVSMKMPVERAGAITRFFLSTGVAKSARDAQIIMVVIAVLLIAGAAYIVSASSVFKPSTTPLTPQQLQEVLNEGTLHH